MSRALRIGLTGGIGSGKSSVAILFQKLGIPVLDLDRVGHDLVTLGSSGLKQLVDSFGDSIVRADGSLDRAALGRHCFQDAAETAKLNSIMHPLIWQAEQQWLEKQQAAYVIIEASVLLESGGADRMDAVIVILADEQIRLERVLQRGDRDELSFQSIVKRQCSDEMRRSAANWIINNNGSKQLLQQQVHSLHQKILATVM